MTAPTPRTRAATGRRLLGRRRAVCLLLVASVLSVHATAAAAPTKPTKQQGSFTHHVFEGGPGVPSRGYWLYEPPKTRAGMPLLVSLHGCNVTALQGAEAAGFNRLADELGVVVAYPEQKIPGPNDDPNDGNGVGCWNWSLDAHQHRDAGEPATIAGIAQRVTSQLGLDPTRVYIEGISAGANMAAILAATHPDVFAAAAAIAGCSYKACTDATGTLAHLESGQRARVLPTFVANGTADTVSPYPLSVEATSSFLGAADWADDGQLNMSISRMPSSVEHVGVAQTPSPGSGDPCLRPSSAGCPGGVIGYESHYPHTITTFTDAWGCAVAEHWTIHLQEHSRSDAPGGGPFTDPLGPDVSRQSLLWLLEHRAGHLCTPAE